jgi:hypothetical protein
MSEERRKNKYKAAEVKLAVKVVKRFKPRGKSDKALKAVTMIFTAKARAK